MAVPVLDLRAQYQRIRQVIDDAVRGVLESGQFVLGPNVRALEDELASFLGVARTVALASGTDALHLAIRALGIGAGDFVLTSPFTFVATATAISYTGARPVFADIHPATYTLDRDRAAEYLAGKGPGPRPEGRVKALLPVHLYGLPADMDPLLQLARQHRLRVVEDAAQAIGAEYRGRRVGGLGDAGCFSFYPTKNLGAFGDGGLATAQNPALADRILRLRAYGGRDRYVHEELGFNSRLDEIQAAILRVKLRFLAEWNARRRAIAARYRQGLAGLGVKLPEEAPGCTHVYHQFAVRVADRDGVQRRMADLGVRSTVYYPVPLHLQPLYRDLGYRAGDYPEA
ncbi:MAG: DegT/DnrJ/EryC1/StrS family aminotransferase, partial [candidate division NC10 bacterium]|nr:DegT/DnrJ/EryC1/StrS family aminotransferase [candidate division NC10 bacterium]